MGKLKTVSNPNVQLGYNDRVQVLETGETGTVCATGTGQVEVRLDTSNEKLILPRAAVALVLMQSDWF
jgi:hypothetical protein